ncbi:cation-translocating P-type ATPase [Gulosibacter molinativorax]|uniref:cation-translocating P-type ATPase n=1 Tax=Gulosibacter molinativorax TaxID=256821 RepID=UPI0006853DDF|nr:HAD-IC family P-type ATPase [Gulosibacter molinativorax]
MSSPLPTSDSTPEPQWHALTPAKTRAALDVTKDGLSAAEVDARLERFGPNELEATEPDSWIVVLLRQFRSPMVLFLLIAAVITALQREWFDTAVIALTLLLNASIGFWQERKSDSDVRALQQLTLTEATVVRDGTAHRIPASGLVPGDTIRLESGDQVPADARLDEVNGLQIDESMLTGEALPTLKSADPLDEATVIGDRENMAFSGTLVVSGRASAIVVDTGTNTEIGEIAESVQGESGKTPLQHLTDRLEKFIAVAVVGMALLISVAAVFIGAPLSEAFRTMVALIVSALPEALPIVLTVALGVGVSRMAKHHAVVRRLPSVETLGSTTVIGSDKTGTLTINRMTVEQLWTPDGETLDVLAAADDGRDLDRGQIASLRTGSRTNESVHRPDHEVELLGDAVDVAMAAAALSTGATTAEELAERPVADMPYEPEHAYSQSVYREGNRYILHVKGAPDTILRFCHDMAAGNERVALDPKKVRDANLAMARNGLRVIATATAEVPEPAQDAPLPTPRGLTFTGLQGMMDPPRPGVAQAIADCKSAGIHVMMITGDHPATAESIGKRLGLEGGAPPLTGAEMAELDDFDLIDRLHETSVAARMSPQDKLRIVRVLQSDDEIVAVTGDGVNDAPALKAASIGVAMGASGTDVAREAADVVLTDDNFVTIVEAVKQGRVTFSSIRKATYFLLANGLAALLAVAVNTFTDLPLIFLPATLIFMNVVTNGVQDIALAFEPGEGDELKQKPRPQSEGILGTTMWLRTVITGIWMAAGTLVVYHGAFAMNLSVDHARTLALITMVMFNFFNVFNARAERRSVFSLNPLGNPLLFFSAIVALLLQWGATVWPVSANLIGLEPLSAAEWLMCTLVGATVMVIVELEKLVRRLRG